MTPSGEALLPRARSILALASQLVVDLAQVSTDVNATLVVAAVESLNAYVLPSRLAALRARWPKVRLEVVTGACAEIQESVAAGKSDLGLVLEGEPGGPDGGEDESILTTARLAVLAAPGHPLVLEGATPDQLRRCELLMSDAGGPYHRLLRQYFEAAQVPLPRTQALGNIEGVKRGLLAGGDGPRMSAGTRRGAGAEGRHPRRGRGPAASARPGAPCVDRARSRRLSARR